MGKAEFLKKLARAQFLCETADDLMGNSYDDHFALTAAYELKERGSAWVRDNYDSVSADIRAASGLAGSAAELLEELYDAVKGGLE